MEIFEKTEEEIKMFDDFSQTLESVATNLKESGNEKDFDEIIKIKNNFKLKINDFFREDRKLNIGVIGQVKAGKSSFLNTLLFDGKEVLPKASTPKTATLTKMEYSDENKIEIEYYSIYDWEEMQDNSTVDSEEDVYTSAREIMEMVKNNGIDPMEYIQRGKDVIKFDSYSELTSKLNDYVGENGKFTPVIKSVVLYMNRDEFKEISIVDTPGLNDPIASRTQRTQEFIEVCDVVFFLSQSSQFLDKSDWELLSLQLPQKGAKKLVLIASKYDSALRDILCVKDEDDIFSDFDDNKADNIKDGCYIVKQKLKSRAKKRVSDFIENLEKEGKTTLIETIKECQNPILMSAITENMSKKDVSEYSDEEKNIYEGLEKFSDNIYEDLKFIGNIKEVQDIFYDVKEEKQKILQEKAQTFIPTAKVELKTTLENMYKTTVEKLNLLSNNDRKQLVEQKNNMERQINNIKAQIENVYGELFANIESEKINTIREIRSLIKDYNRIEEKTGVETKVTSYSVSDSKWYKPWTWGKSHKVYSSYDVTYTYLQVSDAISNLRTYSNDCVSEIEKIFSETVSIQTIKRKLLNVIVDNFDMGNDNYDPAFFKIMVTNTLNNLEFPIIKIDISDVIDRVSSRFSGEVTSSSEKSSLLDVLDSGISKIFDSLSDKLESSVRNFKNSMQVVKDDFLKELLENINAEFNEVLTKCDNKDKEIQNYKEYIELLEKEIKRA